jgi:hypothetical protein
MLLVGLKPDGLNKQMDGDGVDFLPQKVACQELGSVMMVLLPGIDVNDQSKTMATISFYLSVLSNCVAFTGQDLPAVEGGGVLELGFYVEDFVIGFLQRVFGVINDLEVTSGAADGTINNDGCAACQHQCLF